MHPIKAIAAPIIEVVTSALTAGLKAAGVKSPAKHKTAIRIAAVALTVAGAAGAAYAGGVKIDWRLVTPFIGELLAPV